MPAKKIYTNDMPDEAFDGERPRKSVETQSLNKPSVDSAPKTKPVRPVGNFGPRLLKKYEKGGVVDELDQHGVDYYRSLGQMRLGTKEVELPDGNISLMAWAKTTAAGCYALRSNFSFLERLRM